MASRRLHILHAIHDFLPRHVAGSEIYAFDLCTALAARHHVTVLCAEYDPARRHGEVRWRVHGGLPVVEVVNNWTGTAFSDTYRPAALRGVLGHVLDALEPDVLHVHNLLNLSFDLPADARARGIPVVATAHDYTLVCPSGGQRLHQADQHLCGEIDPARCARCFGQSPFGARMAFAALGSPRPLARMARAARGALPGMTARAAGLVRCGARLRVTTEDVRARLADAREVLRMFDVISAPSAFIASELSRLGADPSTLRVSDYGFVRLEPLPRARRGGPLRLGFVGTLVWHKGVHVAIDALRLLPSGACELLVYGDPAVFPEYAARLAAAAAGLPVRFMGRFDRSRTAEVYAGIDLLVVPSLWFENSPLVIHEAFMAGVPVVGSRIGGIPGLVRDGWNGLLFETGSAPALAAALAHLLDEPSRLDALAARLPAVKPIEDDARDWEAIYGEVLARRGRPVA